MLLVGRVLSADVPDAEAAYKVVDELFARYPTVQIVWVDSAYVRTVLLQWALEKWERLFVPVRRPEGVSGWVVLPKRWVVERSFNEFRIVGRAVPSPADSSAGASVPSWFGMVVSAGDGANRPTCYLIAGEIVWAGDGATQPAKFLNSL